MFEDERRNKSSTSIEKSNRLYLHIDLFTFDKDIAKIYLHTLCVYRIDNSCILSDKYRSIY